MTKFDVKVMAILVKHFTCSSDETKKKAFAHLKFIIDKEIKEQVNIKNTN